jgi:hypothetical protein
MRRGRVAYQDPALQLLLAPLGDHPSNFSFDREFLGCQSPFRIGGRFVVVRCPSCLLNLFDRLCLALVWRTAVACYRRNLPFSVTVMMAIVASARTR